MTEKKTTIDKLDMPFGIDISRYQGLMDWNIVANHIPKVRFIGVRAGISWAYKDSFFATNWAGAKNIGLYRTAYHVLWHNEDSQKQMNNLFNILGNDMGELPITLDCELEKIRSGEKISKDRIRDSILECSEIIRARSGRKPIIYSRALWIKDYVTCGVWLNDFYWWLAQYTLTKDETGIYTIEDSRLPNLPPYVSRENVIIHQTGDHTKSIGGKSKMMDYNRWLAGDLDSLLEFVNSMPTTTHVQELTTEVKINKLWNAHPQLHNLEV